MFKSLNNFLWLWSAIILTWVFIVFCIGSFSSFSDDTIKNIGICQEYGFRDLPAILSYAVQLGRLDFISGILASLGIIIVFSGIVGFVYIRHDTRKHAEEEINKYFTNKPEIFEQEIQKYLNDHQSVLLETFQRHLIENPNIFFNTAHLTNENNAFSESFNNQNLPPEEHGHG